MITIGIDPHKRSLTAVAVEPAGRPVGQLRLAVTTQLEGQLLAWAQAWPDRQWAVEGASGLGRGVAQLLAAAGEQVLDVPAKLAARARLLGSGSARKTDATDAASVAAVGQRNERLRPVHAEGHTAVLRLLSDRRQPRRRTHPHPEPAARPAPRPAPGRRETRPQHHAGRGRAAHGPAPHPRR